jgi:hypothetical protein
MIHLFDKFLHPIKYSSRTPRPVFISRPQKKPIKIETTLFVRKRQRVKRILEWFEDRDYQTGIGLLSDLTQKYRVIERLKAKQSRRNENKLSQELSKILLEHKFSEMSTGE